MTIRKFIRLLLGLSIFSCNQTYTKQDKFVTQDTISKTLAIKEIVLNKITGLLDKALTADTLEFNNEFETNQSFLFFKSGQIIDMTEKNALVVICPTDTTYTIRLYSIQYNKWNLADSITGLQAYPIQFNPIFDDYNFDGQTDIYIQVSASNGWSLSRGHLIIIDPISKMLELHKEARDFANITTDIKTKTIKSELWNGDDLKGRHKLTIFTNRWVNGQLKTMSKKNITIESNK